jgi:hypothetical protein
MNLKTTRVMRVLFFVYVAFTFLHIAYVVNHEPFAFDAWNVAVDTHAEPASLGRFFSFWHQQYTTSNPRIGQPLAYLAYKLVGVAEIGTPLAFFGVVVGAFVFGTGRWPKLRDNRDLAALSIAIGFLWFVAPNFPAYMFCRAYATNYLWLAALQFAFLVPLRLMNPEDPAAVSLPRLVGYFVLGVVAGMGNEHVGPTLLLGVVLYGVWIWRKHQRRPALLWVGAFGLLVGYALIFFAPGQSQRYEGLAEHYSAVQQILVRGIAGNIDIYTDLLEAAAPMLALVLLIIGVGMIADKRREAENPEARERQRRAVGVLIVSLVAASLITITVFASPKLGPRFYFHSMFLVLGAVLGVTSAFLQRAKHYLPFIIVAVISSGYAAARTIPMYSRLSAASDERLAALAATPPGGDYTAEAWEQVGENWWTLGDDMRDQKKQELVARYFGLHRAPFRGGNAWKFLGVTDVKATMHYEFEDPKCMDELDQLNIKEWVGRDIKALHHAFLDAIVEIQRFGKLKWIDLTVSFLGADPPLPSNKLYIAKWNAGKLEGYTAKLKRVGRNREREIVLDPNLRKEPWNIYLARVGDKPRLLGSSTETKRLSYVPSRSGQYWFFACKPDYCFIVLAVAHSI